MCMNRIIRITYRELLIKASDGKDRIACSLYSAQDERMPRPIHTPAPALCIFLLLSPLRIVGHTNLSMRQAGLFMYNIWSMRRGERCGNDEVYDIRDRLRYT